MTEQKKSCTLERAPYRDRVTQEAILWFTRMKQANLDFIGYESAEGPAFFERFTHNHDAYYPYHEETNLIHSSVAALEEDVNLSETERLVIVGQGPWTNCLNKEGQIIRAIVERSHARPKSVDFIEISEEFNAQARVGMHEYAKELGLDIRVRTYTGEFEKIANNWKPNGQTTVISTGSMIGNLDNAVQEDFPQAAVKELMNAFGRIAGRNGTIILGYDGNLDEVSNKRAYSSVDLSHFFYNMIWEIHTNSHGLSLRYLDDEGDYQDITKEQLMNGEIVRYKPVWKGHQIQHHLEFLVPVEMQADFKNPDLLRIADDLECRNKINGGLNFKTGSSLVAMTSEKFSDQDVSNAAKTSGLQPVKAHKDSNTGLCLHTFRVPAITA